jgi:hypothetical protein
LGLHRRKEASGGSSKKGQSVVKHPLIAATVDCGNVYLPALSNFIEND